MSGIRHVIHGAHSFRIHKEDGRRSARRRARCRTGPARWWSRSTGNGADARRIPRRYCWSMATGSGCAACAWAGCRNRTRRRGRRWWRPRSRRCSASAGTGRWLNSPTGRGTTGRFAAAGCPTRREAANDDWEPVHAIGFRLTARAGCAAGRGVRGTSLGMASNERIRDGPAGRGRTGLGLAEADAAVKAALAAANGGFVLKIEYGSTALTRQT